MKSYTTLGAGAQYTRGVAGAVTQPQFAYGGAGAITTRGAATTVSSMPRVAGGVQQAFGTVGAASVMRPATYTQAAAPATFAAAPATYAAAPATQMIQQSRPATYTTGAQMATTSYPQIIGSGTRTIGASQTIGSVPIQSFGAAQTISQPVQYQSFSQPQYQTMMQPGAVTGSVPVTYIGGANITTQSANLAAAGQIISQRVVPMEEARMGQEVISAQPMFTEVFQQEVLMGPSGQEFVQAEIVQTVVDQPGEIVQGAEGQVDMGQAEAQPDAGLPRVVIICTSASDLAGNPTGAWSEEITGPYYTFLNAGCEVYIASIAGGPVPIDQNSLAEGTYTENDRKFQEEGGMQFLDNSFALADISYDAIDCVWLAGGHGTCVDFEANLSEFVTYAAMYGRPVGAVCHGVIGLLSAVNQDGTPLLQGKNVTGFSNAEEEIVGLVDAVQATSGLVENRMQELGANYTCGPAWSEYALADGLIITGQNPQSSVFAASLCVQAMMPPESQQQQ